MKRTIYLKESELKNMIAESVRKIFENTLDVDDSDIWNYADFDSESKWLDSFGKMPKGYDKDITDDETIDRMIGMNNGWQNTISPSGKRAEKLASWDAFDRDRDENNKWITRDEDEMYNDENFNIYESVKRNVRHVLKETSYGRMAHNNSVKRALNENLDDDMVIWDKRGKDEFALILKKIDKKVSNLFGGEENEYGFKDTPLSWIIAEYSLDGNRKRTAKKVYSILNNYDMLHNGDKILDSLVKKMLILGQQ